MNSTNIVIKYPQEILDDLLFCYDDIFSEFILENVVMIKKIREDEHKTIPVGAIILLEKGNIPESFEFFRKFTKEEIKSIREHYNY